MESNDYSASGEIGNSVHRITIKSVLEIISLSKTGKPIHKESGIGIFEDNAILIFSADQGEAQITGPYPPFGVASLTAFPIVNTVKKMIVLM